MQARSPQQQSSSGQQQDRIDQTDMPVGEILRRTRLYYNLQIEDIENALRIRVSQLTALEEGRIEQLPGRVYAIGFVRAYAEFLGLDGDKIVHLFKSQLIGNKARPELNFPVSASESKLPNGYILWGSLAGLLLIIVLFSFLTRDPPKRVIPEAPSLEKEEFVLYGPPQFSDDSIALDHISTGTDTDDTIIESSTAAEPSTDITISVTDNAWVEIRNKDNKVIISRILKKGDRYLVPPEEEGLVMDTGNIGALEFLVGEQKIAPLGEKGDIRRNVSLSPEALLPQPSSSLPSESEQE